jgi:hypothetical protein
MEQKFAPKGVFIAGKARISGLAGRKDAKVSDLLKERK